MILKKINKIFEHMSHSYQQNDIYQVNQVSNPRFNKNRQDISFTYKLMCVIECVAEGIYETTKDYTNMKLVT